MNRDRIATILMLIVLFLLPWQTRSILSEFTLDGELWEYGKLSIYAVEFLLIIIALIRPKHIPLIGSSKPIGYGILLIGGGFISLTFSQSVVLGIGQLFHLASAFLLFYLILDQKNKTHHLAFAFVLGLIIPSILGWFQVITGTSPASTMFGLAVHEAAQLGQSVVETESGRILRAYGSLSHPNVFGGFLAVGTVVLAWFVHKYRTHKNRWWLAIPIIVSASTLVITFSRSAWLGVVAGFLVLLALMLWFKKFPPREAFPLATIGILTVLVTLIIFNAAVFTRFSPNVRLEAQSIDERAGEYSYLIDVVKQNPITGIGIGQYTLAYGAIRPGAPVWVYQPIHNSIALIFAEIGLVGFLLFIRWFTAIDSINYKVKHTAAGMFGMSLGTVVLVLALLDHYAWSSWTGLALIAFSFAMMLRWSLEAKVNP